MTITYVCSRCGETQEEFTERIRVTIGFELPSYPFEKIPNPGTGGHTHYLKDTCRKCGKPITKPLSITLTAQGGVPLKKLQETLNLE